MRSDWSVPWTAEFWMSLWMEISQFLCVCVSVRDYHHDGCLHHISNSRTGQPQTGHCTPNAVSQLLNILRITFSNFLAILEVAEDTLPLAFFITTTHCWNVFHLDVCCKAAFGTMCPGAWSYSFPDWGLLFALLQLQGVPASPSSHVDGAEWPSSLVQLLFSELRFAEAVFHAYIDSGDVASISQKDTNSNMPAIGCDANNHSWFEPDTQYIFSSTVQVSLIWL